ncbi:MAG: hypothetical protein ACR2LF_07135 [Jatrophihabitantaceae bacterium]
MAGLAEFSECPVGQALRDARHAAGLSQEELAAETLKLRARYRVPAISLESARRQIIEFEHGRETPGPRWRPLLAEALQLGEAALFGVLADTDLPRALLLDVTVTGDVVEQILDQRAVHTRAEHIFGPGYAKALVDRDLTTIEKLIAVTPAALRRDARRAAALIAELGGWIAQDSGDLTTALRLTTRAEDNARAADPALRAMILMRRSNILTSTDPELAVELAADAAALIKPLPTLPLHASIARQQALAALADKDEHAFTEHAWYAAELAHAEPGPDELASYISPAYIASETASGLLTIGQAERAVSLLAEHVDSWPTGQQRDHAVARVRLLHALIIVGDYQGAIDQLPAALRGFTAVPSVRTRDHLRLIRRLLTSRARTDRSLPLTVLRRRIGDALQAESSP